MSAFSWEKIDHRLVALKLHGLADEMREKIGRSERHIRFENRLNANSGAAPHQILEMKEQSADEWAQKAYEIYCEVWQKQGENKSRDFVRAVYERGILPLLRARGASIAHELRLFGTRTNFSLPILDLMVKGSGLRMQQLQDRWRRRIEIEALECDHAEAITKTEAQPHSPNEFHLSQSDQLSSKPPDLKQREAILKKVANPQLFTLLSMQECEVFFEVKSRTLYRWVQEGKLKAGA